MNFRKIVILPSLLVILISCTAISEKSDRVINTSIGSERVDGKTYTSKGQNYRIRFIIVHYTVSNRERSIDLLTNKEVSSHYLISDIKEDPIYYLVDENKRAWHAGISSWGNFTNLNDNSIGIEIVNKGYTMKDGEMYFHPYTSDQIKKVAVLLMDLSKRYDIDPKNILGHSDIAPQRKQDPGAKFPWKELYEKYGIGIWYDTDIKEKYQNTLEKYTAEEVQKEFQTFGYSIQITGKYDEQTKDVISAFQYRFRPEKYNGLIDNETFAILKSLNEKYIK